MVLAFAQQALLPPVPAVAEGPESAAHVPNELIIRFNPGVNDTKITRFYRSCGLLQTTAIGSTEASEEAPRIVRVPPVQTQLLARILRADPRVRYVEFNYTLTTATVPNDPRFSQPWGLSNAGQSGGRLSPIQVEHH